MKRREFIRFLGGAVATWPLAARAQQPPIPVIGYLSVGSPIEFQVSALREGLSEQGYEVGRNVAIEFRAAAQDDQLPGVANELVRRRVAVIVGNTPSALAAKAITSTIPIVFGSGTDP
jgi:putative ABC transport system substrate-binding protein